VQRVSAMLMACGVLFLAAAALPVSFRVFAEPSSARKLEVISAAPTQWTVAQVLFGVGAALPVVGVALLAFVVVDPTSRWLTLTGGAILLVALVPWFQHLQARAADPAAFAAGSLPWWQLEVYFLLTPVGVALLGFALLTSGLLPSWVGWVVIGSMALTVVLTLITRDMVPAVYYLVLLLPGAMLVRSVASPP
jgi:hypothetical protein